ncbi:hypothetical protein NHQ30_006812 [Ciborinia camelliae]|nr:hypothetical protein NHQ30_006812 [Ciborinia camelliae]
MPKGRLSDWPQSIRVLPRRQNIQAGQQWKNLCKTKTQTISSEGGSIADGTCQSTITTLQNVRAMSIAFDTRYLRQYDDMLSVNPCFMNTALTSDRGYVLSTNDSWYRPWRSATPADYSSNKIPSTLLNNLKRSIQKRNHNGLNHEQIEALATHGYHFVSIPSSLTDLQSDFITVDADNTTRRANDEDVSTILQILGNEFLADDCSDCNMGSPCNIFRSVGFFTGATTPAATGPKPVLTVATSSAKPIPTKSAEENKKDQGVENGAAHKHAHFNHRYSHRHHRKRGTLCYYEVADALVRTLDQSVKDGSRKDKKPWLIRLAARNSGTEIPPGNTRIAINDGDGELPIGSMVDTGQRENNCNRKETICFTHLKRRIEVAKTLIILP